MKYLLYLFFFIPLTTLSTQGQNRQSEPFEGCDEIEIVTSKKESDAYLEVSGYFNQKGYELSKADPTFFQLKTFGKRIKTDAIDVYFSCSIRVVKGSTFISASKWEADGGSQELASAVKNVGATRLLFVQLNQLALGYSTEAGSKKVFYLKH